MKPNVTVRKSADGTLLHVPRGTQAPDVIRALAHAGATSVYVDVGGIEAQERTEMSGSILRALSRETQIRIWVRGSDARVYPFPRVEHAAGLCINGRILRVSSPRWHGFQTAWPEQLGSWTTQHPFAGEASKSFISQVTQYLDDQDPTPELNCLRLVVLSGVDPLQVLSLHTSQVEIDDEAISEPVREFFRRIAPVGDGYYFPAGTSHTTLGAIREAWEAMCLVGEIHGPDGPEPGLEALVQSALQVLGMSAS